METLALTTAALVPLTLYLNAKMHLHKDLSTLLRRAAIDRAVARAAQQDRLSPYYFVEANAANPRLRDKEAIWARERKAAIRDGNNASSDDTVQTYTYREVFSLSNQYARWFASQGVRKGDFVGLYMLNSADFLFAWIGLWAVGAAPAMLNYHLRGDALAHCVRVSGTRLVLVDGDAEAWVRVEDVKGRMGGKVRFFGVGEVEKEARELGRDRLPDELRNGFKVSDPMALFYTSGTTGKPKGVPMSVVAAHAHGYAGAMGAKKGMEERYYVCMPFYHATGGLSAMGQVLGGNTVCLAPKFSASNFWRDIRDSRATWFVYVGEILRYLLAAPSSPLDRQHQVRSIFGNGLRPDVWKRFRDRFGITQVLEFFNSTEAMLALANPSWNDFTAHAVGHHGFLQRWKYHNEYVPVAVDAETGEIVRDPTTGFAHRMPYEVGGEILVRLPPQKGFYGYRDDPEATEKKIVRDVFRNGDRYYRSGDALRRDSEGRWFFLDRLGDTFRWKGENVSTAEVSEVLGRYPGILEASVYGVQLPGHDGKVGVAAVYMDPAGQGTLDHGGFLRHARTYLPEYAVPMFLRHVQAPSWTHNHKQNKMPLKQEGVDPGKVAFGDRVFWIEGHGKGATYIPFTCQDWENLLIGKAKL